MMILVLLIALHAQAAAPVEIDLGKLKGEPSRLAWSTDGSQFYLQTAERDSRGFVTALHHYLLEPDGRVAKKLEQEPAWAATYWAKKSAQTAPSMPTQKIVVDTRQETVRATAVPMGGALARGGTDAGGERGAGGGQGISAGEAGAAALQSQTVTVITLRLKGEIIGEWVNQPVVPGLTFGWAPSGGRIAFVSKSGALLVMNPEGQKLPIAAAANASLPAWSDDGHRLAYLERTGKKKAALRIAEVP